MAAAALLHVRPAVVVLDLDGTTLDADHKLAPATLAALRRASKAVRLIFATGRPTWDVQPFVDALGAPVTCVLFNGASCATLRPHTAPVTRFLEPLGGERAAEAYRAAIECGGAVSLVSAYAKRRRRDKCEAARPARGARSESGIGAGRRGGRRALRM